MSFDKLKAVDVTPQTKDIEIQIAGEKEGETQTLRFKAKEISYLQRMHIAQAQKSGGDPFLQLIVYSIVDEAGKHMTRDQADALDDTHQLQFFTAAAGVNGYMDKADEDDSEKKS